MNNDFTTIEHAWKSNRFVVLDTETTGLRYPAEICQISVLDFMGDSIIGSYVKTKHPIPADATRIHGITDEMVAGAPDWNIIREQLWAILETKHVIIYNAEFDYSMLLSTDKVWGYGTAWAQADCNWLCAMKWYAEQRGEWNEYYGNYRWHKLSDACKSEGLGIVNAHDAYGDTVMTYNLVKHIMHRKAAIGISYESGGDGWCQHVNVDDTGNGDRECRDCGKTWTT